MTTIYVLHDALDKSSRCYVGKTTRSVAVRFYEHQKRARDKKDRVCNWIRAVKDRGGQLAFAVLEVVADAQWVEAEQFWITSLRALGIPLANSTDGGDASSYVLSQEAREKIAASKHGVPRSPETRAKLSAARKGKPGTPHTDQTKAKIKRAHLGRIFTPEHCANIGEARKGYTFSPEHRLKLRLARVGRTHSAETRKKIGEAHKGRTKSQETREKLRQAALRRFIKTENP